jgi:hypothetical protein
MNPPNPELDKILALQNFSAEIDKFKLSRAINRPDLYNLGETLWVDDITSITLIKDDRGNKVWRYNGPDENDRTLE